MWAGAIALFFNRWGKIRMLLPYQPDYKQEQLKVPGTGVCSAGACNGQHSHQVNISSFFINIKFVSSIFYYFLYKILFLECYPDFYSFFFYSAYMRYPRDIFSTGF